MTQIAYYRRTVTITLLLLTLVKGASTQGADNQSRLWQQPVAKAHALFGLAYDPTNAHTLKTNAATGNWFPNSFEYASGGFTCVTDQTTGRIVFASHRSRPQSARQSSPDVPRTYRMTKEAAEKKAFEVVRAIGVPRWEEYKHWQGRYIFKNDRYDFDGTWAFVWHRFIGDKPIWDEFIKFQLDDASGELVYVNNYSSARTYPEPKTPKLTAEKARQIALAEWPARVKEVERKVQTVSIEFKATDLFYRHLDIRHDDFGNLTNPKAERRLRLLYGIGIAYTTGVSKGTGYRAFETLLVDAETGEMWRDTPER